jgi:hypothetical protein
MSKHTMAVRIEAVEAVAPEDNTHSVGFDFSLAERSRYLNSGRLRALMQDTQRKTENCLKLLADTQARLGNLRKDTE